MLFDHSATIYDLIYDARGKDYAHEALRLAEKTGMDPPRDPKPRLLDVACGTGEHLLHLQRWFDVEGTDVSDAMLDVARQKLPGVPLHGCDMSAFDLGRRFDVVTCLFAAIGYVANEGAMRAAIACMARHIDSQGVVVVEPALTPERLQPPRRSVMTVMDGPRTVTRVTDARHRSDALVVLFEYEITEGDETLHFDEEHVIQAFTHEAYLDAFAAAGLVVEHDLVGLTGSGLYFGRLAR